MVPVSTRCRSGVCSLVRPYKKRSLRKKFDILLPLGRTRVPGLGHVCYYSRKDITSYLVGSKTKVYNSDPLKDI